MFVIVIVVQGRFCISVTSLGTSGVLFLFLLTQKIVPVLELRNKRRTMAWVALECGATVVWGNGAVPWCIASELASVSSRVCLVDLQLSNLASEIRFEVKLWSRLNPTLPL